MILTDFIYKESAFNVRKWKEQLKIFTKNCWQHYILTIQYTAVLAGCLTLTIANIKYQYGTWQAFLLSCPIFYEK